MWMEKLLECEEKHPEQWDREGFLKQDNTQFNYPRWVVLNSYDKSSLLKKSVCEKTF